MRDQATPLICGIAVATLLLAGTASADKPPTVPRTGGIPACEADLDEANTNLGACTEDLGSCTGDLGTCSTDLGTCEGDLAACEATQTGLPGDGYDDAVEPAGSHGPALAYEVCGDGLTVADLNTGLLWEKKTDDESVHGVDNQYTWSTGEPWDPDGTAFTDFLATLNSGDGFAGHTDWRLPNVKELQSIVDYSTLNPSIDPDFGPTASSGYWSATSLAGAPFYAWDVIFYDGDAFILGKRFVYHVRAVRSGPCP